MHWSHSTFWLLWLAGALVAGLFEIATVDFVFLMFAGGALITSVAATLGAPVPLQVIIFAASSTALLFTVRPPLRRWAHNTPVTRMNVAALVGREARVIETVTDKSGYVKLAGEVWTARTTIELGTLEPGSDVHVVRIDGATALVAPTPAPPAPNLWEGRPTP